jgi:photosystem II stability/assembly factor-like uncharacterized protein
MNMKRHVFFCLAAIFFLPTFSLAQKLPTAELLFAAVVGPSPVTLNSTALAVGSRTLEAGQPNLIKTLRQYLGRELTYPGGLYISSPDSATWQNASWPNLTLRSITMSAASGQPQLLLGADNGVLRPFNNPTGWQLVTDWQVAQIMDLRRDPFDDQVLYACTANGIFISPDGGATWHNSNQGLNNLFVSCLFPDPKVKGRLFAGTEGGLYQSPDGGRNWQQLALPNIPVRAIWREPESWPGIFWVGTERHGLYESVDGGQTFLPVAIGEEGISLYSLAGGGSNRPIYAGAYQRGIFFASSVGQNWQQMPGSERLGSVTCILPLHDRNALFAGTYDRGVQISRDGGKTWKAFGLVGAYVRQLVAGEASWLRP